MTKKKANREDLAFILKTITETASKLLISKNEDYANETDIFQNFEHVAQLVKTYNIDLTTRRGVKNFYILIKFDRYMNLENSKKEPSNESVMDTIVDMLNYMILGEGMKLEK